MVQKKKVTLYKCHFRQFKLEKGVSSSNIGYGLRKLSQKDYPKFFLHQLEVHVADKFINGLGHHDLKNINMYGLGTHKRFERQYCYWD